VCRARGKTLENDVAFAACLFQVARCKAQAYSLGGAVVLVNGAVEPPRAVVIPKVVVWAVGLLTAG